MENKGQWGKSPDRRGVSGASRNAKKGSEKQTRSEKFSKFLTGGRVHGGGLRRRVRGIPLRDRLVKETKSRQLRV